MDSALLLFGDVQLSIPVMFYSLPVYYRNMQ